ncbi:MAG: hypothetical protein Q7R22_014050 [Verrucomicrobiota bacterium JB025]|nr:hypothetical protein [Verrucomicrobiota bacterium JB025]
MRRIGLVLLVAGFCWLLVDAVSAFSSFQHARWVWQSKTLPTGGTIPRDEAVSAMRELSLGLNDRHRVVLIPGLCMLAGGLLIFFAPSGAPVNVAADAGGAGEASAGSCGAPPVAGPALKRLLEDP